MSLYFVRIRVMCVLTVQTRRPSVSATSDLESERSQARSTSISRTLSFGLCLPCLGLPTRDTFASIFGEMPIEDMRVAPFDGGDGRRLPYLQKGCWLRVRLRRVFRSRCLSGTGATLSIQSRSEEHTSELQSLMRSSYAVF